MPSSRSCWWRVSDSNVDLGDVCCSGYAISYPHAARVLRSIVYYSRPLSRFPGPTPSLYDAHAPIEGSKLCHAFSLPLDGAVHIVFVGGAGRYL